MYTESVDKILAENCKHQLTIVNYASSIAINREINIILAASLGCFLFCRIETVKNVLCKNNAPLLQYVINPQSNWFERLKSIQTDEMDSATKTKTTQAAYVEVSTFTEEEKNSQWTELWRNERELSNL